MNPSVAARPWSGAQSLFSELGHGVAKGAEGLFNADSFGLHDLGNLAARLMEGVGHFYAPLAAEARSAQLLSQSAGFIEGFLFIKDAHYWWAGDYKNDSWLSIAEIASWTVTDLTGTFLWVGEMGFHQLGSFSSALGTFSLYGMATPFIVTGSGLINGLLVVNFFLQFTTGASQLLDESRSREYRILSFLTCCRAFLEVTSRIVLLAAALGYIAASASAITSLILVMGTASAILAVAKHLYASGRREEIAFIADRTVSLV